MTKRRIEISLAQQRLQLYEGTEVLEAFPVSTALNGPGEQMNSECTPRGNHIIRAKIGAGLPVNAVLRGRRFTGQVFDEALKSVEPGADWILSRILWLSGLEIGVNRLGSVDSMRRYIYIHGTPDSEPMGIPGSHGCIRMRNDNIIALFDLVPIGCPVDIK